jgi:hypothetical protein
MLLSFRITYFSQGDSFILEIVFCYLNMDVYILQICTHSFKEDVVYKMTTVERETSGARAKLDNDSSTRYSPQSAQSGTAHIEQNPLNLSSKPSAVYKSVSNEMSSTEIAGLMVHIF